MGDIQAIQPYCIPSLRFFCDKRQFYKGKYQIEISRICFSRLEYVNLDNQGTIVIPYAKNKKKSSYNYNFVKFCA